MLARAIRWVAEYLTGNTFQQLAALARRIRGMGHMGDPLVDYVVVDRMSEAQFFAHPKAPCACLWAIRHIWEQMNWRRRRQCLDAVIASSEHACALIVQPDDFSKVPEEQRPAVWASAVKYTSEYVACLLDSDLNMPSEHRDTVIRNCLLTPAAAYRLLCAHHIQINPWQRSAATIVAMQDGHRARRMLRLRGFGPSGSWASYDTHYYEAMLMHAQLGIHAWTDLDYVASLRGLFRESGITSHDSMVRMTVALLMPPEFLDKVLVGVEQDQAERHFMESLLLYREARHTLYQDLKIECLRPFDWQKHKSWLLNEIDHIQKKAAKELAIDARDDPSLC